ncbi:MAG: ChaN family lipoprotein [Gemmatimonadetes bacterium]|nr:ChaN family lipoprotein [Gemmatimonadota bacterium]MDA1102441.1 ChaN family lipoprotein [Gemmatimonadota bacterium]
MLHRAVLALSFLGFGVASLAGQGPLPVEHPPLPEQPVVVDGVDYRVFDRQGNRSSLLAIVMASLGDDVLLIGEEHDDMVGHAIQTQLLQAVFDEIGGAAVAGRRVVLSLEMFERDVQYVVDEYLADEISEDHFLRSSRPWDDYAARYRPAVEAAKAHSAPIVAANAPRRYVSRVTSQGPESLLLLSAQARAYLPPLPYPGPSDTYREQWEGLMTAAMLGMSESADSAAAEAEPDSTEVEEARDYTINPNAIYSQALWDASMGHAISEALVRHLGGFVVHFAGSFHVEKGTGILERIEDYRPGTRSTSVVMTKVDDIEGWSADEHAALADFVILTLKPAEQPPASN